MEKLEKIQAPSDQLIEQNLKPLLLSVESGPARHLIETFFKQDVKLFLAGLIEAYTEICRGSVTELIGQKKIDYLLDRIAEIGNTLEGRVHDKLLTIEIKKLFRLAVGDWIYQSRIAKSAYEKPRGYPGDYEMLELIYNNEPISHEAGLQLDRYFLNNGYAQAVRNRKDKMVSLLYDLLKNNKESAPTKILNIACGSCREIRDVVGQASSLSEKFSLTILDQDEGALKFSDSSLKTLTPSLKLNIVQADVLSLIKDPENFAKDVGEQDLVYSIGLADYLPDRVLSKLIHLLYTSLSSHGQLVIAHKDRDSNNHAPLLPDWFCDWKFYSRSESRLLSLIKEMLPIASISMERDNSGIIIFFKIARE